ncbi:MAG: phosphoglycerate mutase family protein [Proteobacteria bacterium]|nr:phosphoglycerate mutase family protein [Pseudomonadota bacterium]
MIKVFLARHGETAGNSQGLILGRKDYPLTDKGIKTTTKLAHIVMERLMSYSGSLSFVGDGSGLLPKDARVFRGLIVASSLGRALESARIYADKTGWQIEVMAGMAELSCGQWEGQLRSVVAPDRPFIRAAWTASPPEGEGYANGELRVAEVVRKIKMMEGYDVAIVVGHAGINRVFLKLWLEMDPLCILNVHQSHETIYILNSGDDKEVDWIHADGTTGQGLIVEKP